MNKLLKKLGWKNSRGKWDMLEIQFDALVILIGITLVYIVVKFYA